MTPADLPAVLAAHRDWLGAVRVGAGRADLSDARGRPMAWPSPGAVLLASWGAVSDALCIDLMRYDAANHPDPARFDAWAVDGKCPYGCVSVERAAHFVERRELWSPGAAPSAYSLMIRVIAEKMGPEVTP